MSCTNEPVLFGLETAPADTLRRLLAALTLDHHSPGCAPRLFAALEPIVRGEPPQVEELDRAYGELFRDVDYTWFYNDDFNDYYARMQYVREVFVTHDRELLLSACRSAARTNAETLANRAFHDRAHAASYFYDGAALREEVERAAREAVEARWLEVCD